MNNYVRVFGYKRFQNADIQSARAIRDVSLNGRTLDVDTMTVTVVDDLGGLPSKIGSQVEIRRGSTRVGVFYIYSVSRIGQQTYTMQLASPIGQLEQIGHVGGVYNGASAEALITEICGGISVTVEAPFDTATVSGWLPYVSPADENGAQSGTAKDNLMQVLLALNASLWADENGVLHVGNLDRRPVRDFGPDSIFRDGYSIEHRKPVSQIVLTEHSFVAASGDDSVLFDGSASAGQRVIFSEPMHSLTPTGTLTITEGGANYAVLGAGTGTLTGVPYLHITRELTETVAAGAATNKVTISDATLVGTLNSAAVMARLKAYYEITQTVKADVLLEWERPGNVISILDRFSNSMISATIAAISPMNFSQTLRGSIEALVGFEPWNEGAYTQHKVVLTGSGSFAVPAGVTTLTVVLIGGGGGGAAGADGTDAPICEQAVSGGTYDGGSMVGSLYPTYPTYGVGGAAGAGGTAGKVLRAVLTVTPGSTISFACGSGGAGAVAGGDQETRGANGTHTVFGAYDSDSGDAIPYADPGGDVYGGDGSAGVAGGNGGGYDAEADAITPTPSPVAGGSVTYGGVTYNPGADGERQTYTSISDGRTYVQDGSFGGGAAAGADGADGTDATDPLPQANWHAIGGGNGADAADPAQAFFGRGGAGGNGGGGAGSAGWWGRSIGLTYAGAQQGAGLGGAGSAGGKGGDGCVIVYYRTLNS